MARSRNIKPAFFQNDQLVELPFEARLLFIGLWCLADREGRLENRPKKIKMQIFPADNVDISDALLGLHRAGMVHLYVVDNIEYIQIINFAKHQNPHIKEQASTIPAPCLHGASPADSLLLIPDSGFPLTDSLNNVVSDDTTGKTEISVSRKASEKIPVKKIVEIWNDLASENGLPQTVKITSKLEGQIRQRWRDDMPRLQNWENFFNYVRQSNFLMGRTNPSPGRSKPFRATLIWITNESNFAKIAAKEYE